MAADPARLVSDRPATGPREAIPRAEIARQLEIARRAEIARDSEIARALVAMGFAPKRLGPLARQRAHLGQAENSVPAGVAATTTDVARAGLRRCAGVADGTSRWSLKRVLPRIPWLSRHNPNPHRRRRRPHPGLPWIRPRARRNSPSHVVPVSGLVAWGAEGRSEPFEGSHVSRVGSPPALPAADHRGRVWRGRAQRAG